MKVAIIGAGAVGLGLGSYLLEGGARVVFVARRDVVANALAREGLARSGLFGDVRIEPERFEVVSDIAALSERAPDFALVCTKTTATREVGLQLAAAFAAPPSALRVVVCQNGWGNAEIVAEHLPPERVFSARVITGFRRSAPASVEITAHAEPVHLGSLFGADPAALAPLAATIDRGGLPCRITDAIAEDLWAKMLYNGALNPLGALIGVPYGQLAEHRETRSILEAVIAEIFALLAVAGHRTHWESAREYLDVFYRELLPPTAAHESSMLQDLRAGRPSEIEAITGAVVRMAAEHGVRVPVHDALLQLVRARESLAAPAAATRH